MHSPAAEELNDPTHYVPPWTYNPEEGRGRKGPVSQAQAMEELVSVVSELQPDNFTPTIITKNADYLYVEYQSPTFGFIDDVEFWFPKDRCVTATDAGIGDTREHESTFTVCVACGCLQW